MARGSLFREIYRDVLRNVFKEGTHSIPKRQLDDLFTTAFNDEELFDLLKWRLDKNPKRLMKEGWNPKGQPLHDPAIEDYLMRQYGKDNVERITEMGPATKKEHDVEALLLPGFKQMHESWQYPPPIWDSKGLYWAEPNANRSMEYLKDIVPPYKISVREDPMNHLVEGLIHPDSTISYVDPAYGGSSEGTDFVSRGSEFIQRKPGNTLARFQDLYRIIGLTGLLGSGAKLSQSKENPND